MKSLGEILPAGLRLQTKLSGEPAIGAVIQASDKVVPGCAFFAVRGTKVDAHDFAEEALSRGAAVAVVDRPEVFAKLPSAVLVRSTREALGVAASLWYDEPTRDLSLVGVTGTNGKTTTTYLLKSIWEELGIVPGVVGTVATHIGAHEETANLTTPDALALQALFRRMRGSGVTHAAMEVSSIALDQYRTTGCHFRAGIFTNLTQDHLDYHGDFETYFAAKKRLFTDYGLPFAIVNIDDPYGRRLLDETRGARPITFSLENRDADFHVDEARYGTAATEALIKTPRGVFPLRSPLIGRHNLANSLGVLGAVFALGQDLERALDALATAGGAPGRLERVMRGEKYPHVFVDYAHTDDALDNVLRALTALRGDSSAKIITVFGCGGDRDTAKRPRMGEVASRHSDVTIATSDNPRTESPEAILDQIEKGVDRARTDYRRETQRRAAIALALSMARPGDLVLVAGKGHETYQIIGTERLPFDDREVVRDYYRHVQLDSTEAPR